MRSWRSRLGISQEELADRAGLHRTYVSDIERGARNVSLASIDKLATALDVSASTLFSQLFDTGPGPLIDREELVEILFVEDNPDDVALTLHALRSAGIANRIHVVRDGREAIDFLFGRKGRERRSAPQMILLDLHLPGVHGLEILRRIKEDPQTKHIPVVVLTASKQDRDVAASKRLGADAYIIKPVDFQNLSEITPQLSLQWALLKPATSLPA